MIYSTVPKTYHNLISQTTIMSQGQSLMQAPIFRPTYIGTNSPDFLVRIGELVSVPSLDIPLPILKTLTFRKLFLYFSSKAFFLFFMQLNSVSTYFGISRDTENLICTLALYALLYQDTLKFYLAKINSTNSIYFFSNTLLPKPQIIFITSFQASITLPCPSKLCF